jgi:hypothetical protein
MIRQMKLTQRNFQFEDLIIVVQIIQLCQIRCACTKNTWTTYRQNDPSTQLHPFLNWTCETPNKQSTYYFNFLPCNLLLKGRGIIQVAISRDAQFFNETLVNVVISHIKFT